MNELDRIGQVEVPRMRAGNPAQLMQAFQVKDTLITAKALTCCIREYIKDGGVSRGSYLIRNEDGRFRYGDDLHAGQVQVYRVKDGAEMISWRPVHPIPDRDLWFENVWKEYEKEILEEKDN